MVEDEDPDALFRVVHPVQPSFQALHNRGEGMLLNQIQQPLFRLEVVVKSRQRHAARAREIAHRGAFVSFLAEDLSSHPEPYRVKYWEIDNGFWNLPPGDYAEALGQFVPAMQKVDPAIRTIATSGRQIDLPGQDGVLALIGNTARLVDYVSVQHYEYPERTAEGTEVAKFWRSLEEEIAQSKNPRLKLFVSGWKTQTADWVAGLYAGGKQ